MHTFALRTTASASFIKCYFKAPSKLQAVHWAATHPQLTTNHRFSSDVQRTHHSSKAPHLPVSCRASSANRPETTCVVEYLLLVQAKPGADAEEMEVLLDSLWSLQYMIPCVMYAAAGTIINDIVHNKTPLPQQPDLATGSSQTQQFNKPVSEPQQNAATPVHPDLYTHAVHFRLSNRSALDSFMAHPLMSQMQEQVRELCTRSAHVIFEGSVTKRLEALFRRGEEFASGVEHVLLLQPGSNGGIGADVFLEQLGALAESSVAGGIQASHGAVLSSENAAATHVLMTRFAAPQQVQQLLQTPAGAAVLQGDMRVPLVAGSSFAINMQPTEESTRVNGSALGS